MDTKDDIELFKKLEQQLHSFLGEMSDLSHKKPNDPVNKFKLKFLNTTLVSINKIIKDYRPLEDFEQFDVDSLPTNSDVVLVLSQYAGATLRFRTDNTVYEHGIGYWAVRGKKTDLRAGDPRDHKYHPR